MYHQIADEFQIKPDYVKSLIELNESGATVPFIARYRKEQTGGMTETTIRQVLDRYNYLQNLNKRKIEVIEAIKEKGKLTDEIEKLIATATTLKEVEDIYTPYKSKKKTKADIAIEKGLLPLAEFIQSTDDEDKILDFSEKFLNEEFSSKDQLISKALEILINKIGHDLDVKKRVRELVWQHSFIVVEKRKDVEGRTNYEDYYNFRQEVPKLPPHRILAIFRGEKEKILKVKYEHDDDLLLSAITSIAKNKGYSDNSYCHKSVRDAYKRMVIPAIELEIRDELWENAENKAIEIFARNLKSLLMTPPVKNISILGIDPAFRTGCKFAAVDPTGKVLEYGVIYPTEPQCDYENSKKRILDLIKKHNINAIAIGNGTASRETEEFIAKVINEENLNLSYTIVSEAGASVYSASDIGVKEFPDLDVTIRGAISIARRVIDPLAELIKIDPKSIGVGMYQHDVNQKKLQERLNEVVVDVVNSVGVDLNTASASLLKYVSGLNSGLSEKIVAYREKNGTFKSREELKNVSGIGEMVYNQAAGFLKIYNGTEPLDRMFIHPEQYDNVYKLLNYLGLQIENAKMIRLALKSKNIADISKQFGIGELTLNDIITNLEKPDLDIRDSVDPVVFKKGLLKIEDLKEGMIIDGKVTNIVDFGVFVDIGLKESGFIHISELSDRYVKHPSHILEVGNKIKAKIKSIDMERKRISLSRKGINEN
ncbi:helix-hairpin-helix domain-containing protein [Calditerrivibrio nitroreducens]|uniref:RNA-binding transcriptional accessory protein n=1 Tax=Calditerrivibrio nitroreducens TaxID=477976 RepID=A0A2J6WLN5_9BACT|nr:MAG: RNA-binding transcriptional accessory protein [Calditerrivibrio nitroreducens]